MFGGTVNASFLVRDAIGALRRAHARAGGRACSARITRARRSCRSWQRREGVAPAVLHADPQHRFMVMQYIPGRDLGGEGFRRAGADPPARHHAAHAARHRRRRPYRASICARWCTVTASASSPSLPAEAAALDALLRRADLALDACRSEEREPALIHGDLHHSNLIGTRAAVAAGLGIRRGDRSAVRPGLRARVLPAGRSRMRRCCWRARGLRDRPRRQCCGTRPGFTCW